MIDLDTFDKELRLYVGMGELTQEEGEAIWADAVRAKNTEQQVQADSSTPNSLT